MVLGLFTILLTSCSSNFNKLYIVDASDLSQKTMDQVVLAINNEDVNAFKALFAPNTCSSVTDIDKNILELFEFIKDDIVHYNSSNSVHVSKKSDHGKITKSVVSHFSIETKENKYHIAINECIVDTVDKNNEGIFSFNIISEDDWTEDYIYGGLKQATVAGIIIEKTGDD